MLKVFSRMHCPTMPEEKNHYKESSGSSDGQSKAGSDFSKLDSEEYRERPLKTELFPGSNATFRILGMVLQGEKFLMYITYYCISDLDSLEEK